MKHLILVHGRDIKPAGSALAALARRAIVRGLQRAGRDDVADDIQGGAIKFTSAYYGDVTNRIEASYDPRTAALLTAQNDPVYDFKPCFPAEVLDDAFNLTDALRTFNKASYRHVLDIAKDWRFLDEAIHAASMFGELFTFGLVNSLVEVSIKWDLAVYLTSQRVGSDIRARLQDILKQSLADGDDVCLVTHSMGCMVAHDVFWKYSFRSEYEERRDAAATPVRIWLTLGCPLGEIGIQRNLLDAVALDDEKYPRNQFVDWINVHAEDDFIAHVQSMRTAFSTMRAKHYCRSIADRKIYNCWHYRDASGGQLVSNPHDLYGYLMNQDTARIIAGWAE
ncbi:MAG TPA: hypothetical protein VGV39_12465 [Mesorhizobium sp.]|jgi:hypothetical protein|uniref:hypothetical protein n=1 Tax=Mesorhizobium sp. TaxID=1871066 RepID=UPI002DDD1554|nr:hypothetical protein [Mesorhizobium sp.]HEV2503883.1 hypothetical protein [Mesorhizobium sp.]